MSHYWADADDEGNSWDDPKRLKKVFPWRESYSVVQVNSRLWPLVPFLIAAFAFSILEIEREFRERAFTSSVLLEWHSFPNVLVVRGKKFVATLLREVPVRGQRRGRNFHKKKFLSVCGISIDALFSIDPYLNWWSFSTSLAWETEQVSSLLKLTQRLKVFESPWLVFKRQLFYHRSKKKSSISKRPERMPKYRSRSW